MLHESVRHEYEDAGEPTAQSNTDRGEEVITRTEPLLAPDERADERAFKEEREHAFHCQRLPDYTPCILGKLRPISSELKLHGNAGHHTNGEIQSEDLRPEPDGPIVFFITSSQRTPFPIDEEPRQAHGELREQIVIDDCESKLKPAPKSRVVEI